jgi:hypothetical protein
MVAKPTAARFSRAESFLVRLATSMSDPTKATGADDVEASARRVVDYLAARVAEGDLDSVLAAFGRVLGREGDPLQNLGRGGLPRSESDPGPSDARASRALDADPFFWG